MSHGGVEIIASVNALRGRIQRQWMSMELCIRLIQHVGNADLDRDGTGAPRIRRGGAET